MRIILSKSYNISLKKQQRIQKQSDNISDIKHAKWDTANTIMKLLHNSNRQSCGDYAL